MLLQRFVRQFYVAIKTKVTVSTDYLFFLVLAFLIIPIHWVCAWILALFVHELCHYIALKLCGGTVEGVNISCCGIIMETRPLTLGKEAICAYAGPIGALMVIFLARYIPRTAICTLVFSAYNLSPIFPLDGGRGLGCLLRKLLPETAAHIISSYIENGVLIAIVILAAYAVFRLGLGLFPAVLAVVLFWRSKGIKIPCKKWRLGLQ